MIMKSHHYTDNTTLPTTTENVTYRTQPLCEWRV